jgi:ring-1,2-phenylacetyl-CoA epoxidase subunit PaaC
MESLFERVLHLADTTLVLGHRLSEWCGHAPMLEEELALANMGLDLIGQARSYYAYAGEIEGKGRDEDALCFLRDVGDYRNLLLVEQPKGDFAFTMARQLAYAAFALAFHQNMRGCGDETLAAISAKAEKEMAYHLRHSAEWVIRLGQGTAVSHAKMQEAIDEVWPFVGEMFEEDGFGAEKLRAAWQSEMAKILHQATLKMPTNSWAQSGGRVGNHSEHLGHLLAELQYMQRSYPHATW